MRKLASIQIVTAVEPIPEADAIERFRVLGWWIVGKKGEVKAGDRVVYCEIDCLLPERPEFEFLRPGCFEPAILDGETTVQRAGFRIRTIKLRGQVSQGICFPLSILPDGMTYEVGDDVTDVLGIIKYEPPVPVGMGGKSKGQFPAFLPKTDETRIQVLEILLEQYRGQTFYITEKLDGTSFTAFLRDGEFGLCSRNLWLDESDSTSLFARVSQTLELPKKLELIRQRFGFQPAIQGEVIGPGVQKNKYGLKSVDLRIFTVIDIDRYALVDRELMLTTLETVGLTSVPQLGEFVLNHTIDELVEFAIGKSQLNPNAHREGLVFRPAREVHDSTLGSRLSFKVINPQFLLKYDE
jgi:RNA ligase (TIGR02306 family)